MNNNTASTFNTFQFYYGSINRFSLRRVSILAVSFQFYYGSINRPGPVKVFNCNSLFQFYYGSINSDPAGLQFSIPSSISILLWFN